MLLTLLAWAGQVFPIDQIVSNCFLATKVVLEPSRVMSFFLKTYTFKAKLRIASQNTLNASHKNRDHSIIYCTHFGGIKLYAEIYGSIERDYPQK